jgi:hypothetical protein
MMNFRFLGGAIGSASAAAFTTTVTKSPGAFFIVDAALTFAVIYVVNAIAVHFERNTGDNERNI